MNSATQLRFGPQLIGGILLICGLLLKRYPPKRIHRPYGYRSPSAVRSQQTWDFASSYAAKLLIKTGLVALFAGIVLILLIDVQQEILMAIAMIMSLAMTAAVLLGPTEKKLKTIFDKQGHALL